MEQVLQISQASFPVAELGVEMARAAEMEVEEVSAETEVQTAAYPEGFAMHLTGEFQVA